MKDFFKKNLGWLLLAAAVLVSPFINKDQYNLGYEKGFEDAIEISSFQAPSTSSSNNSPSDSAWYLRQITWGKLFQRYGVVYDTLTPYQQAFVNYPELDPGCVYYVKNGKSYHAVNWCYTLANSKNIQSSSLPFARSYQLEPCSKCVDPKQVQ